MNCSLHAAPNFHLVPIEDNGAGQKFEIVGNDPQLILLEECGGAELKLNPGRYTLTFCAHPADGKLKKPMLFLDTGHGFADAPNAKFMLYNNGLDTWSVSFEIDRAVERVRLDPSDPLCSQPTMSRLENAPSKIEVARLMAALVDGFCESYGRGALENHRGAERAGRVNDLLRIGRR